MKGSWCESRIAEPIDAGNNSCTRSSQRQVYTQFSNPLDSVECNVCCHGPAAGFTPGNRRIILVVHPAVAGNALSVCCNDSLEKTLSWIQCKLCLPLDKNHPIVIHCCFLHKCTQMYAKNEMHSLIRALRSTYVRAIPARDARNASGYLILTDRKCMPR